MGDGEASPLEKGWIISGNKRYSGTLSDKAAQHGYDPASDIAHGSGGK